MDYAIYNSTMEERLDMWNNRLAEVLLPNTVILFIYMFLGLVGNAVVICIYKLRFRQYSEDRFFIPHLAFIDSMACVICITANLMINFNPVKYPYAALCKVLYMFSQFSGGVSALMLTVIAVQRFQRICRPFKRQMTLKDKRFSVICLILFSLFLSSPALLTHGLAPVTNDKLNITGHVCATIEVFESGVFPFIYNLTVLLFCIANLIVLCVLYIMIGKAIYSQIKFRRGNETRMATISESSSSEVSVPTESCRSQTNMMSSLSLRSSSKKMRNARYKMSLMFLIITSVYVMCFIPSLAVIVWDSLDKNAWLRKSDLQAAGFRFAYTLYIVNNIVNPIIYGFFDNRFRRELLALLSSTCSCHR